MKTCVFAGTFDPFTVGHEEIVLKALKSYDKVIVVIGVNPEKEPTFSLSDRIEVIKETFKGNDKVEVEFHEGLMMDFMKKKGYTEYIRGIRDDQDLEYENVMKRNNLSFNPSVNTVFIKCDKPFSKISSSMIRNKLKNGESVKEYLPKNSAQKIITAFRKKQAQR